MATTQLWQYVKDNPQFATQLPFRDILYALRTPSEANRQTGTYVFDPMGTVEILPRNQIKLDLKFVVSFQQGTREELSYRAVVLMSAKTNKIKKLVILEVSRYSDKQTNISLKKTPKTLLDLTETLSSVMLEVTRLRQASYNRGLADWATKKLAAGCVYLD